MSDSKKGRRPSPIPVFDPLLETTVKQPQPNPLLAANKPTIPIPSPQLLNDDATIQVAIKIPKSEHSKPAEILLDDASTEIFSRQELFAQAARLEQARRHPQPGRNQHLEMTTESPFITDCLPGDIRPTIATSAIGERTIEDQEIVKLGSWRECIVEVDDQLCLVVPIEIARSGLLKPGRRLVARIRSLDE